MHLLVAPIVNAINSRFLLNNAISRHMLPIYNHSLSRVDLENDNTTIVYKSSLKTVSKSTTTRRFGKIRVSKTTAGIPVLVFTVSRGRRVPEALDSQLHPDPEHILLKVARYYGEIGEASQGITTEAEERKS